MAIPSRMLLKSTSAALNVFNKSKPILNQLPVCASAGLAIPSATSRYIDQLAVSKPIIGHQQLPVRIGEEMLLARGRPPKPNVVDSEEDDGGDEDDEIEDCDDSDEIEDELEDAFDDDEDDMWKKVRTRSDRDAR